MKKILLVLVVLVSLKVEAQSSTFSRIDSLLAKGRYQLALKSLQQIDSVTHLSYYKIGAIYSSIDNHKRAIDFYTLSLDLKENYKAKLMLGKSYQKMNKHQKAIAIYESLLKEDAENLLVAYQLGKLYAITNKLSAAEKIFIQLSEKDRENPNYHYQLGLISIRKAEGMGMLYNFLDAYKSDSTHFKSIYQLAKIFTALKMKDSAKTFINRGLKLDSLHMNLNKLKINELFRKKKYEAAVVVLKMLDSVKPNELYIKKMLGRSYFNLKAYKEAKESFLAAKKIDKDDFRIATYLGHIYKLEKKYGRAMIYYFRATTIGKKSRHDEYFSLGMLHLEMKNPAMAIKMFKESIKESNRYYKVLYQLAITSDSFYSDKKIAYQHYENYLNRFNLKDKEITDFVKNRMKEIKKELFLKAETVE